jgi:hypothetical protein
MTTTTTTTETNLPPVGSRVKVLNDRSRLHGETGTVVCHQLFGSVPLVGVLFAEGEMPVGCSPAELFVLAPVTDLPTVTLNAAVYGNASVTVDGQEVASGELRIGPGTYEVIEFQPVEAAAYCHEAEVLLEVAEGVYAWCSAEDVAEAQR